LIRFLVLVSAFVLAFAVLSADRGQESQPPVAPQAHPAPAEPSQEPLAPSAESLPEPPPRSTGSVEDTSLNLNDCPSEPKRDEDFPTYDLGKSFRGVKKAASLRTCLRPQRVGKVVEPNRANYRSFIYGDCTPTGDAGCAPGLEVQVFPVCDRNLSLYQGNPVVNPKRLKVRGVPAAYFDGDIRLELYTGDVTIVIFGLSKERVMQAAEALRSARGGATPSGADLPDPVPGALTGKLKC
jgi:hypothetical protein